MGRAKRRRQNRGAQDMGFRCENGVLSKIGIRHASLQNGCPLFVSFQGLGLRAHRNAVVYSKMILPPFLN
jgi:hypothetical protein